MSIFSSQKSAKEVRCQFSRARAQLRRSDVNFLEPEERKGGGEGWAIPTTQPLSAPLASQLNFLENSMDFFYYDFISNLYCKIAFFGLLRPVALRSSIPSRREARFQIWLPNRSALPASQLNFLENSMDFFYYEFVSNFSFKVAFLALLRPLALWSRIPGSQ